MIATVEMIRMLADIASVRVRVAGGENIESATILIKLGDEMSEFLHEIGDAVGDGDA